MLEKYLHAPLYYWPGYYWPFVLIPTPLPLQLAINDQAVWSVYATDVLVTPGGIIKSDNSQADIIAKDIDYV